jgi:hypothetical protein
MMEKLLLLIVLGNASVMAQSQSIRNIDFKNRTYNLLCGDVDRHTSVHIRDGEFHGKKLGIDTSINLYEVVYGDLTRDGKEEAVILYGCGSGASYAYFRALLFTMKHRGASLVAEIAGGNKGDGGFESVTIRRNMLIVNRYQVAQAGSACCPILIESSKYRLRNGRLSHVVKPTIRKIPNP